MHWPPGAPEERKLLFMKCIGVALIVIGIVGLIAIALFPSLGLSGIIGAVTAIVAGVGFCWAQCLCGR